MFRASMLVLSLSLTVACRSSEPAPEPAPKSGARQFVSGDQSFKVVVEGVEYAVEYDLPPGRWDGPRKTDGAVIEYDQGPHHLWVALGHVPDFEGELVEMRKFAGSAFEDADVRITEPGRRADITAKFRSEEGTSYVNRLINVRPDPVAPVGVAVFHQGPEAQVLDLEPTVRSIRVTRK